MSYRLVIFDFDGTLADSFPWFLSRLDGVAKKFNFRSPGEDQLPNLRDLKTREILRYLKIPFWKLPRVARHVRELAAKDRHAIPLFPETASTLRAIHSQGLPIAIVSSNSEENVRAILGSELTALVSYFIGSASLFGKAPLLLKATRAAGVRPRECIYIGDEGRDIDAARKVGAVAGAVGWGYASLESLRRHRPNRVFESHAQLLAELRP